MPAWITYLFTRQALCAAVVVLFLVCAGLYTWERRQRKEAETAAIIAQEANRANIATLEELQRQQEEATASLLRLEKEHKELVALQKEVTWNVQKALQTNADARFWADQPVPDELVRILNQPGGCKSAGNSIAN